MNLEKFNAQTTPAGTKLITRDGTKVDDWHYFKNDSLRYPVFADVCGSVESFSVFGEFDTDLVASDWDLFIAPKIESIWVNVYRSLDGTIRTGTDFYSQEEATNNKLTEGYIKTIKITDEI